MTSKQPVTEYDFKYPKPKPIPRRQHYAYMNSRLMWPIDVYREWYEYTKLADKLPPGLKAKKTFKEWFDPALFAEPTGADQVEVVSVKGNVLTLKIDLTLDFRKLMLNILNIIHKHVERAEEASRAKFQPSKSVKDIKVAKLSHPRKVYALKQQGLSNLEIAYRMKFITKEAYEHKLKLTGNNRHTENANDTSKQSHLVSAYDSAVRKINRDVKTCKTIIANVEAGTFP